MSADAYWRGPCMELPARREADRLRADRENRTAWLHGAYVYRALLSAAPVLNALSKRRQAHEYPEPLSLDPRAEAERGQRRGIEYMRAAMEARARARTEAGDGAGRH